ncbi:MAG: hypothetical protein JW894_11245 [Bacteroidales bacterium]|nr:hypothetical protein [Bacteroidales bacterium]
MKKTTLTLLLISIVLNLSSQEINVKKGTITDGNVQIAKIDGKVGMFRNDSVMITSLNNKPLLLIEQQGKMFSLPNFSSLSWFQFNFYTLDTVLYIMRTETHTSTKMLSKWLLERFAPGLIVNNEINTEVFNSIASEYNKQSDIENEIASFEIYDSLLVGRLKAPRVARDIKEPFTLKFTSEEDLSYFSDVMHYNIWQDNKIIGQLDKIHDRSSSGTYIFLVYKKLETPIETMTKTYEYGIAAEAKTGYSRITTFVDKGEIILDSPVSAESERIIINLLIKKGYL